MATTIRNMPNNYACACGQSQMVKIVASGAVDPLAASCRYNQCHRGVSCQSGSPRIPSPTASEASVATPVRRFPKLLRTSP